ncbi:MAG: hypothetical protein LBQ62_09570 [Candidatus Accumulibacter sp.]|jgi:hypothetical protein|nr:hypothetical protein [Accumulibacter sp.]
MQDHRQQPSSGRRRAQGAPWVGLKNHPFFMSASLPTLMVMYPPRRLALPIHNRKQIGGMAAAALAEAFSTACVSTRALPFSPASRS